MQQYKLLAVIYSNSYINLSYLKQRRQTKRLPAKLIRERRNACIVRAAKLRAGKETLERAVQESTWCTCTLGHPQNSPITLSHIRHR